jgi:hypothetical protein
VSAAVQPEPEPEPQTWVSLSPFGDTAEQVDLLVGRLPAIGLSQLEAGASLLTRVDRKYVVALPSFARLVSELDEDWRALEIDGRRLFGYRSTYFDSPDFATYRAHLQRRRRRFKVRVRRYAESGGTMLEVKRKGLRGITVKDRTPHPEWSEAELGAGGLSFVAESVRGYAPIPDGGLAPVVEINNRRATLVHLGSTARVTLDVDLSCGRASSGLELRPGLVLIETKVEGGLSRVDRTLRRLGERPTDISKFCIGVTSLDVPLPSNPWRRTVRRYFETATA